MKGLGKDIMQELLKKYPLCQEFQAIHLPSVNPEVKHMLDKSGDKKDNFQLIIQDKLKNGNL